LHTRIFVDPSHLHDPTGGARSRTHSGDSSNDPESAPILIQYLIKLERHRHCRFHLPGKEAPEQNPTHPAVCLENVSFRTALYIDQETAYFLMEKGATSAFEGGSFSQRSFNKDDVWGQNPVNALSDKNFFFELYEYMHNVDSYLFNNICTYHNIVKNSVLKVVESPPSSS
jgi:hypothetical protein